MTVVTAAPSPVPLIRRRASSHIDRAVRAGDLSRVARGVYAPTEAWSKLAPWNRYLARVHAAAQEHPDAVFVRDSAAALRGLAVFGEPRFVHAVVPGSVTTRRVGTTMFHGAERDPRTESLGGILVATPGEVAADAARLRHPAIGLAVANSALRADRTLEAADICHLVDTHPSSRGRARARWVTDRVSAIPESPLESVSAAVIEWLGFPTPDLQTWVRGLRGDDDDRVDFAWPRWRVAGEADGAVKYSGAMGDARGALRARGIRDARLMRRGMATVRHWGWGELTSPDLLDAILSGAGIPHVSPREDLPLLTLPTALRGAQ